MLSEYGSCDPRASRIDDVLVKVATSLCGGSAFQIFGTCGALSGGIMVLDYFFSRPIEKLSNKEVVQDGRFYYALDPDEEQKIAQAEAELDPKNCGYIVGNAVRWVVEIPLDKDTVELSA